MAQLKKERSNKKEWGTEFVIFFIILKEKYNCKKKHRKYQNEKYWKFPEIIGLNGLNNSAKIGIESEKTIELPNSIP